MLSATEFQKLEEKQKLKEAKEAIKAQAAELVKAAKIQAKQLKEAEKHAALAEKQAVQAEDRKQKQQLKDNELKLKAEERIKRATEKAEAKAIADNLSHVALPDLEKVLSNGQKVYHNIKLVNKTTHECEGTWLNGRVVYGTVTVPPQAFIAAHSLDLITKGLIKRALPHTDIWDTRGNGLYVKIDGVQKPIRLLTVDDKTDAPVDHSAFMNELDAFLKGEAKDEPFVIEDEDGKLHASV